MRLGSRGGEPSVGLDLDPTVRDGPDAAVSVLVDVGTAGAAGIVDEVNPAVGVVGGGRGYVDTPLSPNGLQLECLVADGVIEDFLLPSQHRVYAALAVDEQRVDLHAEASLELPYQGQAISP